LSDLFVLCGSVVKAPPSEPGFSRHCHWYKLLVASGRASGQNCSRASETSHFTRGSARLSLRRKELTTYICISIIWTSCLLISVVNCNGICVRRICLYIYRTHIATCRFTEM